MNRNWISNWFHLPCGQRYVLTFRKNGRNKKKTWPLAPAMSLRRRQEKHRFKTNYSKVSSDHQVQSGEQQTRQQTEDCPMIQLCYRRWNWRVAVSDCSKSAAPYTTRFYNRRALLFFDYVTFDLWQNIFMLKSHFHLVVLHRYCSTSSHILCMFISVNTSTKVKPDSPSVQ